jgi:hypothetical protein
VPGEYTRVEGRCSSSRCPNQGAGSCGETGLSYKWQAGLVKSSERGCDGRLHTGGHPALDAWSNCFGDDSWVCVSCTGQGVDHDRFWSCRNGEYNFGRRMGVVMKSRQYLRKRACGEKVKYRSWKEAMSSAKAFPETHVAYPCKICGKFHIGRDQFAQGVTVEMEEL